MSSEKRVSPALLPAPFRAALDHAVDTAIRGLAAGTAYELERPLAAIEAHLRALLAAGADEPTREASAVRSALDATSRAKETVRGLQVFARPSDAPPALIDVHEAIEVAVHLAQAEMGRKATLVRRYGAVGRVRADISRLANVIVAVLRNAADAIPDAMPHANGISIETRSNGEGDVIIEISDTGIGIEPEDLPYVFDPFFTTKPHPTSTGLGLAVVRAAVLEMGGTITLESVFGRGTRARVTLPAEAESADPPLPYGICETMPLRRVLCVGESEAEAARVAALFEERDTHVLYATCSDAIEELALRGPYDLVACGARGAAREAFHASLRRMAPDVLARTFDVAIPVRASGTFRRIEGGRAAIAATGE